MSLRNAAVLAALALPCAAFADPVTFDFSGEIVFGFDPAGYNPVIAPGTAFTGSITVETATPGLNATSYFDTYPNAVVAFTATIGSWTIGYAPIPLGRYSPQTGEVSVENDRIQDGYDGFSMQAAVQPLATDPANPGNFFRYASIFGVSSDNTTFSDLSIPTSIDINRFNYVPLQFYTYYNEWTSPTEIGTSGQLGGRITSITVRDVPEPGTAVLFASAMGLLGTLRRRKTAPRF